MEGDQAEGNNDQEYSLLMNVPTEKERRVAAKCDCAYKGLPRWFVE